MLKKLIFAPIFPLVFTLLIYQFSPFLKSYDLIFSLSLATLVQLVTISGLILLSSFSFVLFTTFALDWKYVLPTGILGSLIPMIFLDQASGLVFFVGLIASLLLSYVGLESTMKSYLTFQPSSLLGPSIRHLSTLLILVICIVYFLSINKVILEKGFQIPDSLIDTALKFAPQSEPQKTQTITTQSSLSSEQIDLLKKNPALLKQYGLDPSILDNIGKTQTIQQTPTSLTTDLIKNTIKEQLQNILKPYLGFIPAVLAVILFLTLQSLTSILNLLIYPLLWITFFILEKTGFIKFTQDLRPVKKMVV